MAWFCGPPMPPCDPTWFSNAWIRPDASTVDPSGRIHAFEDQVGSHGGIGGPQNHAILIHPRDWSLDVDLLEDVDGVRMPVGPVAVHRQLLRWRRRLGAGPDDSLDV